MYNNLPISMIRSVNRFEHQISHNRTKLVFPLTVVRNKLIFLLLFLPLALRLSMSFDLKHDSHPPVNEFFNVGYSL